MRNTIREERQIIRIQRRRLIDRELHKTNCVFPERTLLKYCLASSVKAGFTLGMQKQMGCL